jgi:hypothetical protein
MVVPLPKISFRKLLSSCSRIVFNPEGSIVRLWALVKVKMNDMSGAVLTVILVFVKEFNFISHDL